MQFRCNESLWDKYGNQKLCLLCHNNIPKSRFPRILNSIVWNPLWHNRQLNIPSHTVCQFQYANDICSSRISWRSRISSIDCVPLRLTQYFHQFLSNYALILRYDGHLLMNAIKSRATTGKSIFYILITRGQSLCNSSSCSIIFDCKVPASWHCASTLSRSCVGADALILHWRILASANNAPCATTLASTINWSYSTHYKLMGLCDKLYRKANFQ